MHDDEIIAIRFDRRRVYIALAQLHIAQARAFDTVAGDTQHLRRLIDAGRPRCERPQEFEHPAGAGAKIKQRLDRVRADGFADRRLDSFLRNMQGTHLVQFAACAAK